MSGRALWWKRATIFLLFLLAILLFALNICFNKMASLRANNGVFAETLKPTTTGTKNSLDVRKNAVVTLANANYERCGIKLVRTIRKFGMWTGDIVFMASYEVDANAAAWLIAQNVTIFPLDTSRMKLTIKKNLFLRILFFAGFRRSCTWIQILQSLFPSTLFSLWFSLLTCGL